MVGRTSGANTFPLRNQSLALESLKDQLGFLVTIILGGDSLIHKQKKRPRNQSRVRRAPPRGCDKIIDEICDLYTGLQKEFKKHLKENIMLSK